MTPAVDSRHAGATMSDREFASLQARRNAPFTSKTEKVQLTRQINKEIAARKAGTSTSGSTPQHTLARTGGWEGAPLRGELSEAELKGAWASWKGLNTFISEQGGRVLSSEGGETVIQFPNARRADGFYDKMISRYLAAKSEDARVRVRRPKSRSS